jgi:hypothetical protein
MLPGISCLFKLRFVPALSKIEDSRHWLSQPQMRQRHQQRLCRYTLLPRFSIRIDLRLASLMTMHLESDLEVGNVFQHGPFMTSYSSFNVQGFAVNVHCSKGLQIGPDIPQALTA